MFKVNNTNLVFFTLGKKLGHPVGLSVYREVDADNYEYVRRGSVLTNKEYAPVSLTGKIFSQKGAQKFVPDISIRGVYKKEVPRFDSCLAESREMSWDGDCLMWESPKTATKRRKKEEEEARISWLTKLLTKGFVPPVGVCQHSWKISLASAAGRERDRLLRMLKVRNPALFADVNWVPYSSTGGGSSNVDLAGCLLLTRKIPGNPSCRGDATVQEGLYLRDSAVSPRVQRYDSGDNPEGYLDLFKGV